MARHTGARFRVKRLHERTKQDRTTLLADEPPVRAVTSRLVGLDCLRPVSYTHLTLPTILRV